MGNTSVVRLLAAVIFACTLLAAGCGEDLSEQVDSVETEVEAQVDEAVADLERELEQFRDDLPDEITAALDEAGATIDRIESASREELRQTRRELRKARAELEPRIDAASGDARRALQAGIDAIERILARIEDALRNAD